MPALDPLASLIETGGPVMAVLLAMSVIAQAIVLMKLWQFLAVRIGARRFIAAAIEAWRAGRPREALAVLDGQRNPVARVMEIAVRGLRDGRIPEATIREELTRVATAHLEALRSQLRGLEIIGNLSPLLGLLGTVMGMIEAFRQLEAAGSRVEPAILSGGIWEALLTTAAGLTLAIPSLLAHHWLEGAIDRLQHRMEDAVTQIFTAAPFAAAPAAAEPATLGAAEPALLAEAD